MYKKPKTLNSKRTNSPINKWSNKEFSEEEMQMTNKYILSHKGNANQNYTKISSYPSQIAHHQENKKQQMLAGI
jgi:hypothetical protein